MLGPVPAAHHTDFANAMRMARWQLLRSVLGAAEAHHDRSTGRKDGRPCGCPRVSLCEHPRSASDYAGGANFRPFGITLWRLAVIVGGKPVAHPLPSIAQHVMGTIWTYPAGV